MRKFLWIVWLLVMLGIGIFFWKHYTPVYVYLAGVVACFAIGLMCLRRDAFTTSLGVALVSFSLSFGIIEYYLYATNLSAFQRRFETQPSTYTMLDPQLGYVPKHDISRATVHMKNTLIYDVTYTKQEGSHRITPHAPEATQGIFFFGCSFTYGEGVEDAESLPYLLGKTLGSSFQVYNLAYSGYGPHQFLAALELGRYDHLFAKYKKIHIFYMIIRGHEFRSAGVAGWDEQGPRYILKNDKVMLQGTFADRFSLENILYKALSRSFLWKTIQSSEQLPNQSRLMALQNAILLEARQYLLRTYPHATLSILIYPGAEKAAQLLQEHDVDTINVGQFMPDYANNTARYQIPVDLHPNALAYERIADGLVLHMTKQ